MLFLIIDGQLRHFCSKILRDIHYDSPYRLPKKFSVRGSWQRLRRKLRGKHRRVCPGRRTKVERGSWIRWKKRETSGWLVSVANRSALVVFALPICHSRPGQEHAAASWGQLGSCPFMICGWKFRSVAENHIHRGFPASTLRRDSFKIQIRRGISSTVIQSNWILRKRCDYLRKYRLRVLLKYGSIKSVKIYFWYDGL